MTIIDVISQTQVLDVEMPVQVVTVDPISSEVTVVNNAGSPVAVTNAGPQGPPGSGTGFNFSQASPLITWTINHNMGYKPSVQTFTVGGLEILGEVQQISNNQVLVTFNTATAGTARLV